MSEQDHAAPPINPLPGMLWLILLAVALPEALFTLGGLGVIGGPEAAGWRLEAAQRLGFSGAVLEWMIENGRYPADHLLRLAAYPFVQAGAVQAVFALVLIAALGKMVGERVAPLALLALFWLPALVGALVYGLALGEARLLIGALPGIFGLVGAFTWLLQHDLAAKGARRWPAFSIIAVLLVARLGIGLIAGLDNAWLAEIAGFAVGFGLTGLVTPGGWTRSLVGLRRR